MVTGAKGPELRTLIERMPYTLRVGNIPGGEAEYISIQAAINYAISQTPTAANPWTILISPGTYDEALTLGDYVNLVGIDKESCVINIDHATLITMAEGCCVANLTLDVTGDATGTGEGIDTNDVNCRIEDLIIILTQTANMAMGIVESAGAAARTIYIRNVRMHSPGGLSYGIYNDTANKTFYIENCYVEGDYALYAAAVSIYYSSHNRWEGSTNSVSLVAAGTVEMSHDSIIGPINQTFGTMTYKNAPQQYEVWEGMRIQDAITAAAADAPAPAATAPYTVLIHPGIYDEAVTCASWVNLKGIGPKGSVVIYQANATIITLATNVELQNFTLRLGAPDATKNICSDGGAALTAKMTDLVVEITTPGAISCRCFMFTSNGGDFTIERCSYDIGGTGNNNGVVNLNNPCTMRLIDNDFNFENVNAQHIRNNSTGTWHSHGNLYSGTGAMFSVTGTAIYTGDNDAMISTAAWVNIGSTMTLRNCAIEAPVVAGNLATVRMKNCSYRAIQRAGTGNILDESPGLKDAPWKVHKWDWMTALANADIAVRGTPVDAGSGQILLEVNTGGAVDAEAVESNPEAAGSLGNEFTPARTPRFLTQIVVDNFHPDADMFFGLRETLGASVPAATEDHAGFGWNGANFIATSDDGVATQTTNLTTPTVNVQVQLEVIVFGGLTTVGWVEFYIDGILVATHATRIPVNGLDWQHLLNNGAGGGAAADIDVTVRPGGCQACPA